MNVTDQITSSPEEDSFIVVAGAVTMVLKSGGTNS